MKASDRVRAKCGEVVGVGVQLCVLRVDTKNGISASFGTDKRLETDVRDVREATDLPAMTVRQTARRHTARQESEE